MFLFINMNVGKGLTSLHSQSGSKCDFIQSSLQHAILWGTGRHAPMLENTFPYRRWFEICIPLVYLKLAWKCPGWFQLRLDQGSPKNEEEEKHEPARSALFSLVQTAKFHFFFVVNVVTSTDFRTPQKQISKILTSKARTQGPLPEEVMLVSPITV